MKKQGQVVNAQVYRLGKRAARWAATGMNIGEGRALVVTKGRALLGDAKALEAFGAAVAIAIANGDGETMTQSTVLEALGW